MFVNYPLQSLSEKKEEIWLTPMTKTPTPTEKFKKQRDNIKTPPKTLITQRLRTDLGRSVGVTAVTLLVCLNRFTSEFQISMFSTKLTFSDRSVNKYRGHELHFTETFVAWPSISGPILTEFARRQVLHFIYQIYFCLVDLSKEMVRPDFDRLRMIFLFHRISAKRYRKAACSLIRLVQGF